MTGLLAHLLVCAAAAAPAPSRGAPPSPSSRLDKMARILALEDARSPGDGELERALADPDRGVRRRAALAAGRIGDGSLLPALLPRLADGEPEVRQMAAFALGLIGDARAKDALLAALKDPETAVRARAVEAVGRIGDATAAPALAAAVVEAIPKGAAVLTIRGDDPGSASDPWLALRLGLFALVRLKNVPAAEGALLADGKSRFDWWAATWTAMRLEAPSLRPVLVAATSSSDPLSRALAARGLGALKDPAGLDAIAPLLRDLGRGTEEGFQEPVERSLEVPQRHVLVDVEPFQLVELEMVRRVHGFVPVHAPGTDDPHGRLLLLHDADLHRGGVRAKEDVRTEIEGVRLGPGGMALRDVQRPEVVPVVLDLRPFGEGEPHAVEDLADFAQDLGEKVLVSARYRAPRKGDVAERRGGRGP